MVQISSLSFLSPGNFPDDDPYAGLENTLKLYEYGESLGFNGAWTRQRHLEHGVSSGATFLAAASQRTSRIELGTAVIQIGFESPFRLAEDLSTADILSRGRLQVGVSAGTPRHIDLIGDLVFDGGWKDYDFSYSRIERLITCLNSEYLGGPDTVIHSPGNVQRPRMQPRSPGLADRVWYGGSSAASIRWAGTAGVNLLTGNIVAGEGETVFSARQVSLIREYRDLLPAGCQNRDAKDHDAQGSDAQGSGTPGRAAPGRVALGRVALGRVALGRVIVPFDSADRATRKRYAEYEASRHERTLKPQGPRGVLFAPDVVGTSDEIVEQLLSDPTLEEVAELRMELPYEFSHADYEQILYDMVTHVAPRLGWIPSP